MANYDPSEKAKNLAREISIKPMSNYFDLEEVLRVAKLGSPPATITGETV
jgi:hypothetical protein